MSMFDAPTGTTTSNQTESVQFPQWTQNMQQGVGQSAWNMLSPHLQASPYMVAGMNPDQTMGFDLTRDMALTQFSPNANLQKLMGQVANGGLQAQAASAGPAAMMQAQQLGANDFQQFMNPFTQGVINPAVANVRRDASNAKAQAGAQAAAGGAYGGARGALQAAQIDRGANENVASMVSGLMAQGYDRATANAMANAQMRQQAEMSNQSATNQMNQFNAGLQQQANMANPQSLLAAMMGLDRMQTNDMGRQQSALQGLLGIGNQQQQFAQTVIDSPLRALAMLGGLTPQQLNQTTTQTGDKTAPTGGPSMGNQLLGLGGTLVSKVLGF
jgi:hypothetical protein